MLQLKSRFSRVFAEYLKNGPTDFHHTYVIFRQSSTVSYEIKRLKPGHLLLHGNQLSGMSGIFLRFRTDTAFMS